MLVLEVEQTDEPTRLIADTLSSIFPNVRKAVVTGAGHMGPLTHAADVNALIVQHIEEAAGRLRRHAA